MSKSQAWSWLALSLINGAGSPETRRIDWKEFFQPQKHPFIIRFEGKAKFNWNVIENLRFNYGKIELVAGGMTPSEIIHGLGRKTQENSKLCKIMQC